MNDPFSQDMSYKTYARCHNCWCTIYRYSKGPWNHLNGAAWCFNGSRATPSPSEQSDE